MASRTPTSKPADAARRVDALAEVDTTQPLDQRPTGTAVVKATGHTDDDEFYARGIKIVQRADTLRFEAQTAVDCRSLLDQARRLLDEAQDQQDICQVVDEGIVTKLPDIGRGLVTLFEGWALQRGLNGEGGGGS
jgi:hypothetical protein